MLLPNRVQMCLLVLANIPLLMLSDLQSCVTHKRSNMVESSIGVVKIGDLKHIRLRFVQKYLA